MFNIIKVIIVYFVSEKELGYRSETSDKESSPGSAKKKKKKGIYVFTL